MAHAGRELGLGVQQPSPCGSTSWLKGRTCVRAVGNCCGPTAEQKAAAAADEEAQRKEARAKAAAAAEARLEQNSSRGMAKGSSKK